MLFHVKIHLIPLQWSSQQRNGMLTSIRLLIGNGNEVYTSKQVRTGISNMQL